MHALVDMASSPQYLAPSAQNPESIDIDPALVSLPDGACGSCASIRPSTVAYSNSDHTSYSEVSHISPFDASPVLDDNLLTPVSSAASPQLQVRSCKHSPFLQHEEHTACSQQPTPPHSAAMYSYPEYTTSSMSMQSTVAESPHELLSYLHNSPGHDDPPPPPQSQPYFGSYSVSVPQDPGSDHYYLHNGAIENALGLHVGSDSYTHRPLAPITQAPSLATMLHHSHPSQYRRELTGIPLAKLSPSQSRHASVSVRREPGRKTKARRNRRGGSYSPPHQTQFRFGEEVMATEDDGPDEEVTLDDSTPAELKRLWDVRRKWLSKKGNGMWEDIMVEYLGEDPQSDNKKTQVKAALQMKIHRMLLKHGKWPARDEAALLRAYKRWEENRYNEILRLYEEEMVGRKKAYEWKSQHIEAQLVKMGLEEPERDRDSKSRKRKQVPSRHGSRAGGGAGAGAGPLVTRPAAPPPPPSPHHHRLSLPGLHFESAYCGAPQQHHHHQQQQSSPHQQQQQQQQQPHHHFGHPPAHSIQYNARYDADTLAEQLGAQPPALTDEQRERLIDEVLERGGAAIFEDEDVDEGDVRMSDYIHTSGSGSGTGTADIDARPRAASLIPGLSGSSHSSNNHLTHHRHQRSGSGAGTPSASAAPTTTTTAALATAAATTARNTLSPGPDVNAVRSAAVARGACAEMLKQQQFGSGVGA